MAVKLIILPKEEYEAYKKLRIKNVIDLVVKDIMKQHEKKE